MKTSRHIIIAAMLTLAAFVTMLTISCKNKCGTTTCQNGGSCESNVCVCPIGDSGSSCQYSWSSIFVGTYTCKNENCYPSITSAASWQSVITTDETNGGYTIDIANFNNENVIVVATVDSVVGSTANMAISNSSGINAEGSINIASNVINLKYTVYAAGSSSYTCKMIMTKE